MALHSYKTKKGFYRFGIIAELIVILYLFLTFHTILARRYKTKLGEIDIIARRGHNLIFLEIKARKDKEANEVVTLGQQKRISDAAKLFLQKNPQYSEYNLRFDLIIFNSAITVKHIKNSWEGF